MDKTYSYLIQVSRPSSSHVSLNRGYIVSHSVGGHNISLIVNMVKIISSEHKDESIVIRSITLLECGVE